MSSVLGEPSGRSGGHEVAVAQHGDAVGEREGLVEVVADEDRRDAVGLELADDLEEVVDLAQAERCRGLIHDDDVGLVEQGLGDLHHLLLADAEAAHRRARVDAQMQARQQLTGASVHGAPVEERTHAQLRPQEHVLGDGELGDEVELLVDRHDAGIARLAGRARHVGLALVE